MHFIIHLEKHNHSRTSGAALSLCRAGQHSSFARCSNVTKFLKNTWHGYAELVPFKCYFANPLRSELIIEQMQTLKAKP
jgi:hypothetical protein